VSGSARPLPATSPTRDEPGRKPVFRRPRRRAPRALARGAPHLRHAGGGRSPPGCTRKLEAGRHLAVGAFAAEAMLTHASPTPRCGRRRANRLRPWPVARRCWARAQAAGGRFGPGSRSTTWFAWCRAVHARRPRGERRPTENRRAPLSASCSTAVPRALISRVPEAPPRPLGPQPSVCAFFYLRSTAGRAPPVIGHMDGRQ